MLSQVLAELDPKVGEVVCDCTLGGAGHSVELARRIAPDGLLIGIDQDDMALAAASKRLAEEAPEAETLILKGNFSQMDDLLVTAEIPGVDCFLFDLGVSSPQIDTLSRGFSFKEETAPLDMRMNPGKQTLTAAEVINSYNAQDLTRIIRMYSDEKWASRIASFIVKRREEKPFETSGDLVDAIKAAIPASARRAGGHPAKRTFQAIRIEVNSELTVLKRGLEAAVRWLNPGGRLVVISYHSLEDRIVKETLAAGANRCTCPPDLPVCACGKKPVLEIVTRKPIVPTHEEIERNPRARSAKLRVARKL